MSTFLWKSDIQHSSISFAVSHMIIAEVIGLIKDFDISIHTTKADFSDAKVDTYQVRFNFHECRSPRQTPEISRFP